MRSSIILGMATLLTAGMAGAMAQTTVAATANATIQPAGPRTGASGTNFFNLEGSSNGKFASFGVADFIPTVAPTATGISNVSLNLTESDAAFTAPGSFNIYLATDNTTAFSALKFDTTNLATGGIGTQLGTLYTLGTATFSTTGNTATGQLDTYGLTFADATAKSLFLSDINSGSTIRLALGTSSATTAATFAGSTNNTLAGPTLTYTAGNAPVPEASTTASFGLLLVLGLGGVAIARRRKSA